MAAKNKAGSTARSGSPKRKRKKDETPVPSLTALALGPNHVLSGPPWRLGDETPPSTPKEEPDDIASQCQDVSQVKAADRSARSRARVVADGGGRGRRRQRGDRPQVGAAVSRAGRGGARGSKLRSQARRQPHSGRSDRGGGLASPRSLHRGADRGAARNGALHGLGDLQARGSGAPATAGGR